MARNVKQSWRMLIGVLTAGALVVGALLVIPGARGAQSVSVTRISGSDRYDTAKAIALASFTSATFAVLAQGNNFPDALTGNYLAGAGTQGPILLTTTDTLSPQASSALQTLGVKGVIILGGTAAISDNVEQQLKSQGYQTQRYAGATRYDTSKAVAEAFPAATVGATGTDPTAIIASGADPNFPDALAAGPLSFVKHFPTILTQPDTLSPQANQALTDLGIKHVVIIGGTVAVSTNVETQIQQKGITVQRLGGANRQDTARSLADFELATYGFNNSQVNLALGQRFPDALTGGPHAGRVSGGSPILLTGTPNDLSTETRNFLQAHNSTLTKIDAFGGKDAISDQVLNDAADTSQCTPASSTTSSSTSSTSSSSTSSSSTSSSTTSSSTTSSSTTSTTAATGSSTTSTSAPACSPPPSSTSSTSASSTSSSSSSSTSSSSTSTTSQLCGVFKNPPFC